MSKVNRYRVFCDTEQTNLYTWDTSPPTVCPNNNTHTINISSIVIVDNINTTQTEITNLVSDNTQTLQVLQKNVIINLPPFLGVSLLRNNVITTGSASVSNNRVTESEMKLNCSGADDSCILRSVDRGIYVSGLTCEVGIGIRMPTTLTGNQVLKFGYYSNQNGFYYKLTSTDLQVCIMNNSVELCISRSNFNVDKLDGNGKSGHNLDFSKGNIFIILFSWYGFGLVSFQVHGATNSSKQSLITMHEYQPVGQTSTRIPCLPIQITLNNNGTVANTDVFVAGRQFSILGQFTDSSRDVSMYKYLVAISNELYLPLFSVKRKSEFTGTNIRLSEIYVKSSVDCELRIISNGTLTSSSWIENPYHSESAVEVDITSNAITGGIVLYTMILFAGESRERSFIDIMNFNERNPITIVSKSLTGTTGNITVKLGYKEFW